MHRSGATTSLATFAADPPRGPDHTGHVARALVDTVACALAGAGRPAERILRAWAGHEGTRGRSTVWVTGEAGSASQAALLNATAGHVLDWDDVSPTMPMHPSTVLLPALVAVAEEEGRPGTDLAGAYDVGAAAFRAVAEHLPHDEHYQRGWHTTSTVGRLAAVAALARLCRLDVRTARHALGLVASLSGGSLANFGTMTKPLHAGVAARDAVLAVHLARRGFTANDDQLEDRGGFFEVFGSAGGVDGGALAASLLRWLAEWPRDWALKLHPACYATHRAVDAALLLRPRPGARSPDRVRVTVGPGQLRPLLTRPPRTPDEARFSLEYTVATALHHGDLRLPRFSARAFADDAVHELMSRVEVRERPGPGCAEVTVATASGERLTERVEHAYGDSRRPLSEHDLGRKLADGCGQVGAHAAAVHTHLTGLVRAPQPVSLRLVLAHPDTPVDDPEEATA